MMDIADLLKDGTEGLAADPAKAVKLYESAMGKGQRSGSGPTKSDAALRARHQQ